MLRDDIAAARRSAAADGGLLASPSCVSDK